MTFRETLHGPMVAKPCADCARMVMAVGETDRVNAHGLKEDTGVPVVRCGSCGRRHHGATTIVIRGQYPAVDTSPGPGARRPRERGQGLRGEPCAGRDDLNQGTRHAMCVRCGRVTGWRDGDGAAWCEGR